MILVPKTGKLKNRSLTPVTLAVIRTIGTLKSQVLIKVLLDSSSTKTMIHKCILPRGLVGKCWRHIGNVLASRVMSLVFSLTCQMSRHYQDRWRVSLVLASLQHSAHIGRNQYIATLNADGQSHYLRWPNHVVEL